MRTKIIATLGPASDSYDIIYKLSEYGLDIARMNFSHCTYKEFLERQKFIKRVSSVLKKKIYILQDLQGPRIRVGEMPKNGRLLKEDDVVFLSASPKINDDIFIDYRRLPQEIKPSHPIFLANGDMELVTQKIKDGRIAAKVVRGGVLYSRKAVNVPDTKLSVSGLTDKDLKDLSFGLKHGVDFVAISFVQSADDILKARKIIQNKARIIAKIETAMAIKDIDAIIRASDGIMIARGDLGIEIAEEKIPFIQKNLIRHAAWYNKPSITATQMLTSMVNHSRPTRAEVSDVANAVWDGTDATMLSDETASGQYPVQSIKTMAKIIKQAEDFGSRKNQLI